ncbi:unnamed protein product [Urochloa decumbens]|uniref:F-box domain-containing protein n=1 Tax=Urochloa decumbens TaxID=240449 RepID=A0ABC9BCM8_9POAL
MAAPPELVDDLVEEVLLRIPPDDPASLARAALVSRRWYRVAAGRSFRRRFRERHRRAAPPVLGLLCNLGGGGGGGDDARASRLVPTSSSRPAAAARRGDARSSAFVPTSTFRPPSAAAGPGWRVLDARHGRVLLANQVWEKRPVHDALVVWDPVTGDRLELPELPRHMETSPWTSWNAAVLCAAGRRLPVDRQQGRLVTINFPFGMPSTGWKPLRWPPLHAHEPPGSSTAGAGDDGCCDHIDCRRGSFLVALVGVNGVEVFGHVYSSEIGDWSMPTSCFELADLDCMAHSALVGNAVYFKCEMKLGLRFRTHKILKYDLSTHKMSMTHLPYDLGMRAMYVDCLPPGPCCNYGDRVVLMTTEEDDAGLGFTTVHDFKLHLWAREVGPDYEGWAPRRVIDLAKLIPTDALSASPELVGSVDGGEVFFVLTVNGLFAINLRTSQVRKVHGSSGIRSAVPYTNFCTPALGALATGKEGAGSSSA